MCCSYLPNLSFLWLSVILLPSSFTPSILISNSWKRRGSPENVSTPCEPRWWRQNWSAVIRLKFRTVSDNWNSLSRASDGANDPREGEMTSSSDEVDDYCIALYERSVVAENRICIEPMSEVDLCTLNQSCWDMQMPVEGLVQRMKWLKCADPATRHQL